jgi:hypothetical protein
VATFGGRARGVAAARGILDALAAEDMNEIGSRANIADNRPLFATI